MAVWHWKQTGKVKSLISGCLMSWPKIKNIIIILKCRLFLFYTTAMKHFLTRFWHMTKSGFYTTTSDNQLSGRTEKFPSTSQSQTCTKKRVMVTVWWSAASVIHCSFLNPNETITSEKYAQQISEMHWKLQCLQPALINRKSPVLLWDNAWPHIAQPTLQKLNESGCEVLRHLPYSRAL